MGKPLKPKLTDREELFCYEYIKDLNATQAALRAGYSPGTLKAGAYKLSSNPLIKKVISELMDQRRRECTFDAQRVLDEIATLAFSDISKYSYIEECQRKVTTSVKTKKKDDKGMPIYEDRQTIEVSDRVRFRPWARMDVRPIQSVKEGREGLSIKTHDKTKNLELLARHLKLISGDAGDLGEGMKLLTEEFIALKKERAEHGNPALLVKSGAKAEAAGSDPAPGAGGISQADKK